ncbi:MAG: ATP-binding protein [Synergistales bacterium]|nr:ATP-binding protein [Synergistales bacterium]
MRPIVKEYSPFTPGIPVPPEHFVGRQEETRRIARTAQRALAAGSVERIFVEGPRGMGKSSLCTFAATAVEKDNDILVVRVSLGGVRTLRGLVQRLFNGLVRIPSGNRWFTPIRRLFRQHIEKADIFGVTVNFKATGQDLDAAVNDFPGALRGLMERLEPYSPGGLLFVLDDINGIADSWEFANWFKSTVDGLAQAPAEERVAVTFLLVGIAERRLSMVRHQPSLDRMFDILRVGTLAAEDVRRFYRRAFASAGVTLDDEALACMERFSQGYPVFLHEIGDAVFNEDDDEHISRQDAMNGVLSATRIIGDKYIAPGVLEAISSRRYRGILGKLGGYWQEEGAFGEIRRAPFKERLSAQETGVLDNFLRKMVELGVLVHSGGRRSGTYHFVNILYALYFGLLWETDEPDS